MQTAQELQRQLRLFGDVEKATLLQRFFKTGKGQYGEGDIFLGVVVPNTRIVAKKFIDLYLPEVKELLYSRIHEERLCALLILVEKFARAKKAEEISSRSKGRLHDVTSTESIFDFYIKNSKQMNNWDLVDLSAPRIVGMYLLDPVKTNAHKRATSNRAGNPKDILYKLAISKNLWQKRISILSTFWFIKYGKFNDSLRIAKILMNDKHDLIHKAVGWMLREVGKRDLAVEEKFLKKYYKKMPRTMLRYAIEKFPEEKRLKYLKV